MKSISNLISGVNDSLFSWASHSSKQEEEGEESTNEDYGEIQEEEEDIPWIDPEEENDLELEEDVLGEYYLKKLLLKQLIEDEFELLRMEPSFSTLDQTTLLLFLYKKFLLEFPPFQRQPDFKHRLEQAMKEYPRYVSLARNATRKDAAGYSKLLNLFDAFLRTPAEVEADRRSKIPQGEVLSARREVLFSLYKLIESHTMENGEVDIKEFLRPLIECDIIEELPSDFQNLFHFIYKKYTRQIQANILANPGKIRKLKLIGKLTPRRPMKAILRLANPSLIVNGLVTLFLAKPLGGRNMMQRILVVTSDLSKTEKLIKEAREAIDIPYICAIIHDWVNSSEEFDINNREKEAAQFAEELLNEQEFEYDSEFLKAITNLTVLEMRRKEKLDYVNLVGDDRIIHLVKECIPVIYSSMYEIYERADNPALLDATLDLVKNITEIADAEQESLKRHRNKRAVIEKYEGYLRNELLQYEQCLFEFAKSILYHQNSRSRVEESLSWIFNIASYFQSDKSVIDVKELLGNVPDEKRELIEKELVDYIQENHRNVSKKPTQLKHIPYLLNDFREVIRSILE